MCAQLDTNVLMRLSDRVCCTQRCTTLSINYETHVNFFHYGILEFDDFCTFLLSSQKKLLTEKFSKEKQFNKLLMTIYTTTTATTISKCIMQIDRIIYFVRTIVASRFSDHRHIAIGQRIIL